MIARILASGALVVCLAAGTLAAMPYIPGTNANALHEARAHISAQLVDPTSAQFRNEITRIPKPKDGTVVCGEVNGKNALGAYAGYRRFLYDPYAKWGMPDPSIITTSDDVARADRMCAYEGSGSKCQKSDELIEQVSLQAGFESAWKDACGT